MNMRQLHILFNSAKTWTVIVCWFLCFPPNLPELNLKLFCSNVQNNFRFISGKFGGKHRNQKKMYFKFWLNWIKYGAVSYSFSCTLQNSFSMSWFHWWYQKPVWLALLMTEVHSIVCLRLLRIRICIRLIFLWY